MHPSRPAVIWWCHDDDHDDGNRQFYIVLSVYCIVLLYYIYGMYDNIGKKQYKSCIKVSMKKILWPLFIYGIPDGSPLFFFFKYFAAKNGIFISV